MLRFCILFTFSFPPFFLPQSIFLCIFFCHSEPIPDMNEADFSSLSSLKIHFLLMFSRITADSKHQNEFVVWSFTPASPARSGS